MKRNVFLALMVGLSAVCVQAQVKLDNANTPEALIGCVPEMPSVQTLASYYCENPEAEKAIQAFDDAMIQVKERYDIVKERYDEQTRAQIMQGADKKVKQQTGYTHEQVQQMSPQQMEAMGRQKASQMMGGMSVEELQAMAAKLENMSEEEQIAYVQQSGMLDRMTSGTSPKTTLAQAEQTHAQANTAQNMAQIQQQWLYIDKVYEQERQDVVAKINQIIASYEKQKPKPMRDQYGIEYHTDEQLQVIARLNLACNTECFTLWRNFIAKRQGVLRTRLTECIQQDKLEAQYMQQSGMPSSPQTATWAVVDEYIDITNEVVSLPMR